MSEEKDIQLFFEEDHNRLDQVFRAFQQMKKTDLEKALELFKEFNIGLQRHIVWEEEIMFPLFLEKTNDTASDAVKQMKEEHRKIKKHLDAIHDLLKEGNVETKQHEESLQSVLQTHNEKEENIVYPVMSSDLSAEEKKEVYRKMDEIPEERYHHCCDAE